MCKPEGGKHSVTCIGTKEFSWPKVSSGGPKLINQSGGLVKAQPVETVFSLKGNMVKLVPLIESYNG